MAKIAERTVSAERVEDLISVFGSFDENIHRIEDALGVSIVNRGTELKVTVRKKRRIRLLGPWKG